MRIDGAIPFIVVQIVIGFGIAFFAGAGLLPLLKRVQFRQHAYEDAPQTHQKKTGTPTMGGVLFPLALLPLVATGSPLHVALYLLVLACSAVGFIDDYLAIRRGRNMGLRARTKYLATALIAVMFLNAIAASYKIFPRDVLFHAGTYALVVPHWLWLLLGMLAVTGTIHAVNLTDGLDGLATGSMLPPLAVFGAIGLTGAPDLAAGQAALLGIGACIGFLVYNRHPAKMFMGDTGSLALGALLSGIAILEGEMLLLILIGGVFVAEALSVIMQVSYFKATGGKRIFRMSPLHHHFELGGWPETKVTMRFWLASFLLSLLGWVLVR
jgi:phospho-N-acetylmuramoyl-pentapeptide-transferase